MKTILVIDLGKGKSVFCKLDTSSLKPEYSTEKTAAEKFHDIFADLDSDNSIVRGRFPDRLVIRYAAYDSF